MINKMALKMQLVIKLSGFLFIIFMLGSCNENQVHKSSVPLIFFNVKDNNFSHQQDTIFYKGKYFSGYQFSLFENGDTEFIRSFYKGVEDGFQKKWYDNKQLAEERFYISGAKHGLQKVWWPNGKRKFIYTAFDDAYTGELREWDVNGLLYKDFHYKNGQEEGSEKMWWDNGTVRANYVIRDGKKIWFIGNESL